MTDLCFNVFSADMLRISFELYLKDPQLRPTAVPLPEKSHGRRSLVGYSPHAESDTTDGLHFHFSSQVVDLFLYELSSLL